MQLNIVIIHSFLEAFKKKVLIQGKKVQRKQKVQVDLFGIRWFKVTSQGKVLLIGTNKKKSRMNHGVRILMKIQKNRIPHP